MFEIETLHREDDGLFHATDPQTDEDIVITEMFPAEMWDSAEAFELARIKGYEPMTAKELDTETAQELAFENSNNIIEEKFDGTRALVYFLAQQVYDAENNTLTEEKMGYCRVFSRRISKKTGFYVENTDSLPHIRETDAPALGGTILDGEMFIDGLPFKEVSSTLNCLWDKAVDRQIEKGFITFHAFDILFYRGIDLRKFPLHRRKYFLHVVLEELQHPYIKEVEYHNCGKGDFGYTYDEIARVVRGYDLEQYLLELEEQKDTYPTLWSCYSNNMRLTPRAYYELVVSTGGEGVMIKPFDSQYHHKRGWEYSKIKKFLTRELVVLGFDSPTKEYTGKEIKKWAYWENKTTKKKVIGNFYGDSNYEPVTKFYFNNMVGNLLLGVFITQEEYEKIPVNKRGEVYDPACIVGEDGYDVEYLLMQVCECSGFDDEVREYFTEHQSEIVGTVIEVKANEIFRDSGKLRHPRYMRRRYDKSPEECVWVDHIM